MRALQRRQAAGRPPSSGEKPPTTVDVANRCQSAENLHRRGGDVARLVSRYDHLLFCLLYDHRKPVRRTMRWSSL